MTLYRYFLYVCMYVCMYVCIEVCYFDIQCSTSVRYSVSCGFLGWSYCTYYSLSLSFILEYTLRSCGTCSCKNKTKSCIYECNGYFCSLPVRNQIEDCTATNCPAVNGGWGSWTDWTSDCGCNVTCSTDTQIKSRKRLCNNPEPDYGGTYCSGSSTEYQNAACTGLCPSAINGSWSIWNGWTAHGTCSVTCGIGIKAQIRNRTCTNPVPLNGGRPCNGTTTEYQTNECILRSCTVDGSWSAWNSWNLNASCSVSCGTGMKTKTRQRTCNNPIPQNGGQQCIGISKDSQTISCNTQPCPIDGGWGAWSGWISNGTCSVTCGSGSMTEIRVRNCNNPCPQYGGRQCIGNSTESQNTACTIQVCPIDGNWGDWNSWTARGICSVTCGGGVQLETRNRNCSSPSPQYDGKTCIGNSTESRATKCLTTIPCPIDGGWSVWNGWTSAGLCSVTCGKGVITDTRNRTCNNPIPENDGRQCNGTSTECRQMFCNRTACPIDGSWTMWSSWVRGLCIDKCDGCMQSQSRNRSCTNPSPTNGGKQCNGSSNESQSVQCDSTVCPPTDGVWSTWCPWTFNSACSATCGGGTMSKTRTRTCIGRQYGGRECNGSVVEHEQDKCSPSLCPLVHGGWSAWTAWTPTGSWNVTCFGGTLTKTRTRTCTNPIPQKCGNPCNGSSTESQTVECNKLTCPPACKSVGNFLNCSIPSSATIRTVVATGGDGSSCNSVNCTCDAIVHGYFVHPTDCTKFIHCAWNTPFVYSCPSGTYWDQRRQTCRGGTCLT
ncbi:hypothetical protein ACJMK2_015769 [Sinanodonta woodiana]|uniref:Chitin-binding type-2 domain-containing protein n=1 Tax=Sinanodonta woodiana TaxID=1069815 RepID=A0ABD3UV42_SINWO